MLIRAAQMARNGPMTGVYATAIRRRFIQSCPEICRYRISEDNEEQRVFEASSTVAGDLELRALTIAVFDLSTYGVCVSVFLLGQFSAAMCRSQGYICRSHDHAMHMDDKGDISGED